MLKYLAVLLTIIGLSVGQILFKYSANTLKTLEWKPLILIQPSFIAVFVIYTVTALIWVWALQELPLSRAYLCTSMGFILVPILAYFLFQEPLTVQFIIGTLLISTGVLCVVL